MQHPKPPPLPPVTNRVSLISIALEIPSLNPLDYVDSGEQYMPMSPTPDRAPADSAYQDMGSVVEDAMPSSVADETNEDEAGGIEG